MYERLREIVRQQGLSINKLALLSNITPADLYSAMSGKKPFFPNWRKRVALTLNVTEDELFVDVE